MGASDARAGLVGEVSVSGAVGDEVCGDTGDDSIFEFVCQDSGEAVCERVDPIYPEEGKGLAPRLKTLREFTYHTNQGCMLGF